MIAWKIFDDEDSLVSFNQSQMFKLMLDFFLHGSRVETFAVVTKFFN